MPHESEIELSNTLRAALKGDESAYRTFLTIVTPIIRRLVIQKVANTMPNDIDEIIQDVLFALHLKRHTWQTNQPVLPWVYAITRYRCIDYSRKNNRIRAANINSIPEEDLAYQDNHAVNIDLPLSLIHI